MNVSLKVPGTPKPKGRPRRGRNGAVYTPAATRAAEETMAGRVAAALPRPWEPLRGPLVLTLRFVLPVPVSWPKAKRAAALADELQPTGKPDLDNLVKLAKDACNGLLWVDDSQIVSVFAQKSYGETPCTSVVVSTIGKGREG